jgi:hypothetical protein
VVSKGPRPETQAVPKELARLFRKAKRPEDRCLNTSSLRGVRDHRIVGGSRSSPSSSRLAPKGFEARAAPASHPKGVRGSRTSGRKSKGFLQPKGGLLSCAS